MPSRKYDPFKELGELGTFIKTLRWALGPVMPSPRQCRRPATGKSGTLGAIRNNARRFADVVVTKAHATELKPELAVPFNQIVVAMQAATNIAWMRYKPAGLTPIRFVQQQAVLQEFMQRVKTTVPAVLRNWPKTAGTTFFLMTGDCGLETAMRFCGEILNETWQAELVVMNCTASMPTDIQVHPKPHLLIATWRDATAAALQKNLPTWPLTEFLLDQVRLESALEDEYKRAMVPVPAEQPKLRKKNAT